MASPICAHTQREYEWGYVPIGEVSCFSDGSREEGVWRVLVFFLSHIIFAFLLYPTWWSGHSTRATTTRAGSKMIPKHETVTMF